MINTNTSHQLLGRKVNFDFNDIPKHWIADDPLATHILNMAHVILPAGEFWFCRVFNKALPYVENEQLKADVKGFIHQEAIHGRTHEKARIYFEQHSLDFTQFTQRMHYIFEVLLGDSPLGLSFFKQLISEKQWLKLRIGMIAGIEHYTGVVGQWSLDNSTLDDDEPIMVDLFRWHLAEEVEHRNVAFDLFKSMYSSDLNFQVTKNVSLIIVLPLLLSIWILGTQHTLKQDQNAAQFSKMSMLRILIKVEKTARKNDHLPRVSRLIGASLRWFHPRFHPELEGNTKQALAYLNHSMEVLKAK